MPEKVIFDAENLLFLVPKEVILVSKRVFLGNQKNLSLF